MIVEVVYKHWLRDYVLESVTPNPIFHRADGNIIYPSQFPFSYPSGFIIFGEERIKEVSPDVIKRFKVIINTDKDFSKIENVMIHKVSLLVKGYLREQKINEILYKF